MSRSLRPVLLVSAAIATLASLLLLPADALRSSRTAADEPQYLLTAISLFEDRDLDIADELAAGRWRAFHAAALPTQTAAREDGRQVSPHDPGLPVLLALPVAVGGWAGAKAVLAALNGALAAVLIWTAVRRFGVDVRVAGPAVLAFAVAPPLAVYGAQVYPELPAACCLAGIVALAGARRRAGTAAAGVAVLAVAAAWLSVKYVPVVGTATVVALWWRWRRDERRIVGWSVAALAAMSGAYAMAHLAWYGGLTAYASGDFFEANGGQLSVMGDRPDRLARTERLIGLLVDRDFGLVAWQPAWLLLVAAIAALVLRRPPGWVLLAGPLAVGWAMATWVAVTMHGWWWPGRHVLHALPCAVLAVAWWLGRIGAGRTLAWAALVVGATSTLWLAAEATVGDLTLVLDPWATSSPVHRLLRSLLPDLRADRPLDVALLVLWIAAIAATVVTIVRRRSILDDVVTEPFPPVGPAVPVERAARSDA